jgi:hypothetical protein
VLLCWAVIGRWIARWCVPLFVASITCGHCGDQSSVYGRWSCACGYRDFKERNILTFRCPLCGSIASHTSCARCDATILIW